MHADKFIPICTNFIDPELSNRQYVTYYAPNVTGYISASEEVKAHDEHAADPVAATAATATNITRRRRMMTSETAVAEAHSPGLPDQATTIENCNLDKLRTQFEDGVFKDAKTQAALGQFIHVQTYRKFEDLEAMRRWKLSFLSFFVGINFGFWPAILFFG